jgi:hypothetical protein
MARIFYGASRRGVWSIGTDVIMKERPDKGPKTEVKTLILEVQSTAGYHRPNHVRPLELEYRGILQGDLVSSARPMLLFEPCQTILWCKQAGRMVDWDRCDYERTRKTFGAGISGYFAR